MLIQRQPRHRTPLGWLVAAALGVAAGLWLGNADWTTARQAATAAAPRNRMEPIEPPLLRDGAVGAAVLPQLRLSFAPADWQRLATARDQAMQRTFLLAEHKAPVPVTVQWGEATAAGTARLKGDWLDHIDTAQWSLRLELDTPLQGLRRFSIQHPKTRGWLMEWLVMQTAARLGVLAPRAHFAEVAIDGREPAIYYLEEVPGKEMLESQGRRDGAIAHFDERALWNTHQQLGFLTVGALPADYGRMFHVFDAPADALGASQLVGVAHMEERLQRARRLAQDLQQAIVAQDLAGEPVRRLRALQALEGRTVDDLFVPERMGRFLALLTVYQGFHGLHWNQLRLYHDPVHDRFEPVVNDTDANFLTRPGELVLHSPEARWWKSSPRTLVAAYQTLGEITEPGWIAELVAELRPQLAAAAAAMQRTGAAPPGLDLLASLDLLLRQQTDRLRAFVRPRIALQAQANATEVRVDGGAPIVVLETELRASSGVPTRVDRLEIDKGNAVPAAQALLGIAGEADSLAQVTVLPDGGVLLPIDGTPLAFRMPVEQRVAGLTEVAAIKRAIRTGRLPSGQRELLLNVHFRTVAETQLRVDTFAAGAVAAPADVAARPVAPPLAELLQRHAFLEFDLVHHRLVAQPGVHDVQGDLLVPDDRVLHLPAGTELRLASGAVLVAGALQAAGTAERPVRIGSQPGARGFSVLVLGSAPSRCEQLVVEGHDALHRGGWQATGGVTFCRAPVELLHCRFVGALGEDSLNVIGAQLRFVNCRFDGGPHDLFDGDFVGGEIVDCWFGNSGEDAVDVSGTTLTVRGCTFEAIGDKAFSIGEGSNLVANDNHVRRAAIAVATKDRSQATFERLRVDAVEHFVAAAYVKKPEFGACNLVIQGLVWPGPAPARHLCQTGCTVLVDGQRVPAEAIDVDALYAQKVLGK